MPDEILMLPEAARRLSVAENPVFTMARQRGGPAFNIAGRSHFCLDDVGIWIEVKTGRAARDKAAK